MSANLRASHATTWLKPWGIAVNDSIICVALVFGDQFSNETHAKEVKVLLADLAQENNKGALFLHLTVFGKILGRNGRNRR
ncbi:MAG: hypothetical protein ACYCY3_06845 [Halothiobacillus sp.]